MKLLRPMMVLNSLRKIYFTLLQQFNSFGKNVACVYVAIHYSNVFFLQKHGKSIAKL